jgi:hypothetical protein
MWLSRCPQDGPVEDERLRVDLTVDAHRPFLSEASPRERLGGQ